MPHPRSQVDDDTKRIRPEAAPPPDRTPDEILLVLTKMVNRKVAALEVIASVGGGQLGPEYDEELDRNLDRVCKLAREDRQREPTDAELLEEHDAKESP